MDENKDLSERLQELKNDQGPVSADTPPTGEGVAANEDQIRKAAEVSQEPIVATGKDVGSSAEAAQGPMGLDIGTTNIVTAQNRGSSIQSLKQLNAFFTVPKSNFAQELLSKKRVMYFEAEGQFYIYGNSAESFANMFHADTRRPMEKGILNVHEEDGTRVMQAVIGTLVGKPKKFGETLCCAIPGEPLSGTGSVMYHESIIMEILGNMGYFPVSINEAMAVVMSELWDSDYTGIGINMGGGMCNICLAYLSYPVITYSIQMAGDYIDSMVSMSVGMTATQVKSIKEEELDLSSDQKDRVLAALHIFYANLIFKLLESLQRVLNSTDQAPRITNPIPIVLAGGTAMPKGFKEMFAKALQKIRLPVEISSVRLAQDPMQATAKGALIMAMADSR